MQGLLNLHLLQHLLGYEDAVRETAREVDCRIEIDDELKSILDGKIQLLLENINNKPEAIFTYFIPDLSKDGGRYVNKAGIIKKIDMYNQKITLEDKSEILISEIIDITSDIFKIFE